MSTSNQNKEAQLKRAGKLIDIFKEIRKLESEINSFLKKNYKNISVEDFDYLIKTSGNLLMGMDAVRSECSEAVFTGGIDRSEDDSLDGIISEGWVKSIERQIDSMIGRIEFIEVEFNKRISVLYSEINKKKKKHSDKIEKEKSKESGE